MLKYFPYHGLVAGYYMEYVSDELGNLPSFLSSETYFLNIFSGSPTS